ncbi:MAG TPA: hypothetical protein VG013_06755 [Gemmataceae bacterium]|jgi:hypothetical protein|nr:hypothetical protein [Gemmataceae bacterium]
MQDLEGRIQRLEQAIDAFSLEIRLAYRYIHPDAASSLTKSRIVMEKILLNIYKTEMGKEPKKALLGDILADNQFTRKIDRRILSRMNSIRDMANLGPHGEAVQPTDAERVLDDLCTVLDWCLTNYPSETCKGRGAGPASGSLDQVVLRAPQSSAAHGTLGGAGTPPGHPSRRTAMRTFVLMAIAIVVVLAGTAGVAHFLLSPKKPMASGKFGGIEIGSKGIKMFAGDFFPDGDSWEYTPLAQASENPDLGRYLDATGTAFDAKALDEAVKIVKQFFEDIRDKQGVPADRIFVFCSAGVFANFKDEGARVESEMSLKKAVKKATGRGVDIISEQDKAKYDYMGFSPPAEERGNVLVLHVGSNATEGTCEDPTSSSFQPMKVEYGYSNYGTKVAAGMLPGDKTFHDAAARVADTELVPRIKEGLRKNPLLKERHRIYLTGAIVWTLARYMHPDKLHEKRVSITARDIQAFRNWVATNAPDKMSADALDTVDDVQKQALEEEFEKIQEIFKIKDRSRPCEVWIAGAEILARLSAEYEFENKDPEFWSDSEYACTIGYIVKNAGIER